MTGAPYLLRHVYRGSRLAFLDETGLRRVRLGGQLRNLIGGLGRPVGFFQSLDEGRRFAAYYSSPEGGRVRLDDEDFAVAEVVDASLEDFNDGRSRLNVALRDGRAVQFVYRRPQTPFTFDDWDPGRTRWDMPAKVAQALNDPETREEWASLEWARRTNAISS